MGWESYSMSQQSWLVDADQANYDTGRVIDWAATSGTYVDAVTGKKVIPGGTAMKLSGAGPKMIPVTDTANDVPIGLLRNTASQGTDSLSVVGVGVVVGGLVYENLLPQAVFPSYTLLAALKTKLQALGPGFYFMNYVDSSAV